MPACTTPLLCPVWCAPTSRSFSRTRTTSRGWRSASSRATARPRMPAPTTARSHSPEGSVSSAMGRRTLASAPSVYRPPGPGTLRPQGQSRSEGSDLQVSGGALRSFTLIVAVLTALAVGASDASAAEQHAYAAAMNYATPTITIGKGDKLTFTNLDNLAKHDLKDHDGQFGSDLLSGGQSGPVRGVEKLQPGSYQFHCSLHSWMRGVLQVTPAGGRGTPSEPSVGGGRAGYPTANSALIPIPYDIWPHAARASTGMASWSSYGKDLANSRNGGRAAPS